MTNDLGLEPICSLAVVRNDQQDASSSFVRSPKMKTPPCDVVAFVQDSVTAGILPKEARNLHHALEGRSRTFPCTRTSTALSLTFAFNSTIPFRLSVTVQCHNHQPSDIPTDAVLFILIKSPGRSCQFLTAHSRQGNVTVLILEGKRLR